MSNLETARLPISVPLRQQKSRPPGLPEGWYTRPLADRLDFLTNHKQLLPVGTYISAGLELGAQRMDHAVGDASNTHEIALHDALGTPAVHARFDAGNTEYTKHPIHAHSQVNDTIKEVFGLKLHNTTVIQEAFGAMPGRHQADYNAADAADWAPALQSIMTAQFLHQGAAKGARYMVDSLLSQEPSRTKPGMERQFWRTRLLGNTAAAGTAYHLGYRAKSGPLIRDAMKKRWGDEYTYNRSVFVTAINMDVSSLAKSERTRFQNEVRRPVFALVGMGHFALAYTEMEKVAKMRPQLFSIIGQRFLLRHS